MLLDDSFQRKTFGGGGGELEMAFSVIQHLPAFFFWKLQSHRGKMALIYPLTITRERIEKIRVPA